MMLAFGFFVKPLSNQLQGFGLADEQVAIFQLSSDQITRLYTVGLLTESETKKARQRLVGRIEEAVEKSKPTRN